MQAHTNTLVSRTCEDCHTNPKAIGYGTGVSRSAGERAKVEPEGLCVACHQHFGTTTWDRVRHQLRGILNAEGRALRPEEQGWAVEAALKALAERTQPDKP